MELNLSVELQAKLSRLASEQGRDSETLAREAIERMVDFEGWLLSEIDKGLAAADCGEFIEHADVGKLLKSRIQQAR